jgi:hypothetical protein
MMNKSPEMVAFLDQLSQSTYGRSRSECTANHVCVCCGGAAVDFEDVLSRKEFYISGLCQKCQNDTFGIDNEE